MKEAGPLQSLAVVVAEAELLADEVAVGPHPFAVATSDAIVVGERSHELQAVPDGERRARTVDVVLDEGGRHSRLGLLEGGGAARDAKARGGLVGEREGETQQGRQGQGPPEEDGDAEQRRRRCRADRQSPRDAADEIGRHRHDDAAVRTTVMAARSGPTMTTARSRKVATGWLTHSPPAKEPLLLPRASGACAGAISGSAKVTTGDSPATLSG